MGQSPTKGNHTFVIEDPKFLGRTNLSPQFNEAETLLPLKQLKQALKAILKSYFEEKLLQDYYQRLKKCINHFPSSRLAEFFYCCSNIVFENEEKLRGSPNYESTLRTSPDENDSQPLEGPNPSVINNRGSDDSRKRLCTVTDEKPVLRRAKTMSDLRNQLLKFFEFEIMKKGNIFYELADSFAKMYAETYDEIVKDFGTVKKLLDVEGVSQESILNPKLQERIDRYYEKARVDLKTYQNLQLDLLKGFLSELSLWTMKDESLVPSNKSLDHTNLKLMFGRSECYDTYFTMVRYSTLVDEAKLKRTISKLKNLDLKNFALTPTLCLEKKEAPYQVIIDSLNYLDTFASPYDKFQVIAKMRGQILKEIDKYWKNSYEQGLITNKLSLTADQLLPLHCFCVAHSGNEKMRAHQILIEEFIDEEALKFGEQSYYFTTFKAAIEFLVSISQDPMKGLASLNNKNKNSK